MTGSTIRSVSRNVRVQSVLKPAAAQAELARSYREDRAFSEAERVLLEGVRVYPGDLGLMTELAELATTSKDWPTAAGRWKEIIDLFSGQVPANAYIRAAFAFRKIGDLAQADDIAARGLEVHESSSSLHRELARSAMAREDWATSVRNWNQFLAKDDRDSSSEAYAGLVRSWRNAGDLEGADVILRDALSKFPRDVRLLTEGAVLNNYRQPDHTCGAARLRSPLPPVEIVVCVYNALDETTACLEALRARTKDDQFVTLVDDASKPDVRDLLERFVSQGKNWRLLTNDSNQGYTKSANRGLKAARADWAVLLNSDTQVTEGWLDGLLRCALSDPGIRAVGPLSNSATFQSLPLGVCEPGDGSPPQSEALERVAEDVRKASHSTFPKVPMLNGFCLMLHKPSLEEVGYLDETSFPRGYGEENDLCLRLVVRGHMLAIADDVFVYHARSASFGLDQRRALTGNAVETLKRLWPGYSYKYIWEVIEELPALRELKSSVIGQRAN